jgi:hypothetical protein
MINVDYDTLELYGKVHAAREIVIEASGTAPAISSTDAAKGGK